ncbi:MAG: hypothetical protein LUC17_05345 [Oscillospiraceae bacterium]|nr:hypothetical protein [Oscillospiraceae bacterium]
MEERAILSAPMKVVDPFRGYQPNDEIMINLYDTYLEISGSHGPVDIQYDKLTNIVHGQSEQEHKTENRSVAGSIIGDVAGGLLFGETGQEVGELVGGLAGFSSSGLHRDEYHHRLFLTYLNDEGDEVEIHLMDEKNKYSREIAKELKKHVDIKVRRNLNM